MDENMTVTRWRRYGNDRLYVTSTDGERIGWHDLTNGASHPETPEQAAALADAVSRWVDREQPVTVTPGLPVTDVTAMAVVPPVEAEAADQEPRMEPVPELLLSVQPDWNDLSANRAGAMAREQAQALKDAAPVRTFLARALRVHTDERAWRIGADGEEKVAAQLAKLDKKQPGWRFLHAVPVGKSGSDIDHIAIGPAGVFTINAKHHPGAKIWVGGDTLLVNGQRQPYIRNSRHEAQRAARLLTRVTGMHVAAVGIVVPVRADDVTIKKAPEGVAVVPRVQLARWLRAQPRQLTDEHVDAIFKAARRSTTWQ